MANADIPNGFIPYERVLRARPYQAGGTIYPGDAVKLDSNGQVVAASASNALVGVALSYAVSGGTVSVADHPEQLYIVQADETEVDAQTDINLNYNIVATTGSTAYKTSRMELDSSTQATTATLPLKLLAISPEINNALGAQVKCIVCINNHQLKGGTGTAGV